MKNLILLFGLMSLASPGLLAQVVPGNDSTACRALVAGRHGGNIARQDLLDAGRLVLDGSDNTLQVVSFKMTIVCKEPGAMWRGEGFETDRWGNPQCVSGNDRLTAEMRRALDRARPGCKIYFESIRAGSAHGPERGVFPLAFVLE